MASLEKEPGADEPASDPGSTDTIAATENTGDTATDPASGTQSGKTAEQ